MKLKKLPPFIALALGVQIAGGQTNYTGPVFDLFAGEGDWSNGTPGEGNDGTIAIDYDFTTLGAADNGNVNPLPSGAYSVTQTAGDGTGGQWNLAQNPDFTYNLNGGSLTSTGGTVFVNGHTLNIDGGSLSKTVGETRVASGGALNLYTGSYTGTNTRLIGASSITVEGGTFFSATLDLEGGTFTQSGGTVTTTSANALAQSAAGSKILELSGGTFLNNSATALLASSNLTVTVGGDWTFDGPSVNSLFSNPGGTSTIDFNSDWTGSLTLDAATLWDEVFEEEGRVSVNGTAVTADNFEFYFQNDSGVITLLPLTSRMAQWTGLGGSTWDFATTANFAFNDAADPLNNVTFSTFATTPLDVAIFADNYEFDGGSSPVATSDVNVDTGGIFDTLVSFTNDSTPYVVTSSDANGIAGSTSVSIEGSSTVTLLGTHAYTGATTIEGGTLNLGDGTTDGSIVDSAIANDSVLVITNMADLTHNGLISGDGSFQKLGAGILTLAGNYSNVGSVTVSNGELVFSGTMGATSYSIAPSTVLEINSGSGFNVGGASTTFTGGGTLRKTGGGTIGWGAAAATFAFESGALIDVQAGTFTGAAAGNEVSRREIWTDNLSDLHVEFGATFAGVEGNIRVDSLTGEGTITSGFNPENTGYTAFTFGVDNGSGDFGGFLRDGAISGNYTKVGTGTQTLSGQNFYTGNTTIEEGVLTLSPSGELTASPAANGVSNVVQGISGGTGTFNLDGTLVVEISEDTAQFNGSSWRLIDDTHLTVNYGASFSVGLFDEIGFLLFTESAGIWTLVDGDNTWTFSEATGVLSLANSNAGTITITDSGFDESGNYFIEVAEGVAGLTVTTSPDLESEFAAASGVSNDGANRFTISAGSLDGDSDGKDFFRVEAQ
ncbi:beta strand repeat-containing protein [Roseibacillus persicicus]|uniref:beta strand repeat-containing protein n=1 Tax=Roseibacillus persicicus TaxID=454148 RepID=UPI00280E3F29|nr:autotransporter-associated beta strand repeat-containing protein [Roseibacillus persicicus]MDQ8190412.1 autotransporter-associated beta strand repeat-containing protein [Roseibacillus persicicus]